MLNILLGAPCRVIGFNDNSNIEKTNLKIDRSHLVYFKSITIMLPLIYIIHYNMIRILGILQSSYILCMNMHDN